MCAQSCPALCNPMCCSPPGSSVPGVFQARVLEWVAVSLSRESSRPRDQTWVSCIGRRILYRWSHQGSPMNVLVCGKIWSKTWLYCYRSNGSMISSNHWQISTSTRKICTVRSRKTVGSVHSATIIDASDFPNEACWNRTSKQDHHADQADALTCQLGH